MTLHLQSDMTELQWYPEQLCITRNERENQVFNLKVDYFILWILSKARVRINSGVDDQHQTLCARKMSISAT